MFIWHPIREKQVVMPLSIKSPSISKENNLMEGGLVVETSAHPINGSHGRPDRGD